MAVFLTKAEIAKQKKIKCLVDNKNPCNECERCWMIRSQKDEQEATRRIRNCSTKWQHLPREMIKLAKSNHPLYLQGYPNLKAAIKKIVKGF
jgi:arginyl-tRNA--protein-N-Asp/Glu arginylyltransferase